MTKYSFPVGDTADSIANAISWIGKRPVDRSQVVVEPHGNTVGQYLVTVYESPDLAKKVIPFMDKDGHIPIEVGTLCPVGVKTNRSTYEMYPWQHGQLIGATESGKSSLLHVMLSHVTRCPSCFVWVGGVWKLYDFVSSWVEPYLDTGLRPPIDWIAHGQQDVLNMISAFLNVAAYRMNLRTHQRGGLPYGILILDEVTYIASNRFARVEHAGQDLTASQLISNVARGTAGAKQYMWMTAQRDTQDNFGDDGGTTTAQMGFSFIFYIKDTGSIGRITNDFTLDTPTSKGECWADFGMSGGIHKLRIPYPQADDPLKPVLHGGPKVSDISWSRRNIAHELDAGSASAAGEHYAARDQYVTEDYLNYLTNPPQTDNTNGGLPLGGMMTPGMDAELMAAERDYQRMVEQALASPSPGSHNGAPASVGNLAVDVVDSPPVATLDSHHKTRSERMIAVIAASSAPLARREVIEGLAANHGDHVHNPNTVTNILGDLLKAGRLAKTDDDRYYVL